MSGIFLASVFGTEGPPQRLMHGLMHIHFVPPILKFTDSQNEERWDGGNHGWLVLSNFISVISTSASRVLTLMSAYIPFTLHQTFHTWSGKEALENIPKNVHEASYWPALEEVSPVWCWASSRHSALCGTFSFSLTLWVGSSRTVVAHALSAHLIHWVHKEAPIFGVMRRSWFRWRTHKHLVLLVLHEVWRDAFGNLAFHFTHFHPPTRVFHLSPPFVGIGFCQDQVAWFQWNGIGLAITVLPLPFSLRWGLHLHFLEGFIKSLTWSQQHSDWHTGIFLCSQCGEIKVDGQAQSPPKHQVIQAVSLNSWSHGIVSMHQLMEMLRPVQPFDLYPISQPSAAVFDGLVPPVY